MGCQTSKCLLNCIIVQQTWVTIGVLKKGAEMGGFRTVKERKTVMTNATHLDTPSMSTLGRLTMLRSKEADLQSTVIGQTIDSPRIHESLPIIQSSALQSTKPLQSLRDSGRGAAKTRQFKIEPLSSGLHGLIAKTSTNVRCAGTRL